jgi:hypothetical protein
LKPFWENLLRTSGKMPLWTPSGLTAIKVLSVLDMAVVGW